MHNVFSSGTLQYHESILKCTTVHGFGFFGMKKCQKKTTESVNRNQSFYGYIRRRPSLKKHPKCYVKGVYRYFMTKSYANPNILKCSLQALKTKRNKMLRRDGNLLKSIEVAIITMIIN